jgi:hypothetical protein
MTDRELMQMALEAVEYFYGGGQTQVNGLKLIGALRDRLAQPEPVHASDMSQERVDETAKHEHEWVGLTKEEVDCWELPEKPTVFEFAQFVEAKLKEKNT